MISDNHKWRSYEKEHVYTQCHYLFLHYYFQVLKVLLQVYKSYGKNSLQVTVQHQNNCSLHEESWGIHLIREENHHVGVYTDGLEVFIFCLSK